MRPPGSVAAWLAVAGALVAGGYAARTLTEGAASVKPARHALSERRLVQAHLLGYINERRRRHHLRALRSDPALVALAARHTRRMLRGRFFAHDEPNGSTFDARAATLHRRGVGEVLAWGTGGFGTSRGIISLWMASPEHRRVLLTAGMRRIGIAVFQGGPFYRENLAVVATADLST